MATSWSNESKSGATVDAFVLQIGDGFDLLIDATNKLEIQSASTGTAWSNETKS